MDEAALLVSTTKPGLAVVVTLGRGGTPVVLERFEDASWLESMGLDLSVPGTYQTACGKGYWECEPGEPESLVLKHPAVDLFKDGSANSFFFYDAATSGFRRIWMSD